jgi:hypothetical protein
LDKCYDSRSRFFIETERLARESETRIRLQKEQQEALAEGDSDSEPRLPEAGALPTSFAGIDFDRRDHAMGILNVDALLRATEFVEEEANKPESAPPEIIANSAAFGLQMLAEATEVQQQAPANPHIADEAGEPLGLMLPPHHTTAPPAEYITNEPITSPDKPDDGQSTHYISLSYFINSANNRSGFYSDGRTFSSLPTVTEQISP